MKTFKFFVILFAAISLILVSTSAISAGKKKKRPTPVEEQTTVEWRLVGFTDTTTDGAVLHPDGKRGYSAMHQFCKEEVAGNSRACFASEVSNTFIEPDELITGWVIRSRDISFTLDGSGNPRAVDAGSGVEQPTIAFPPAVNLDCAQYNSSSSSFTGQIVRASNASVATEACENENVIACCAPVAIPVTPLAD